MRNLLPVSYGILVLLIIASVRVYWYALRLGYQWVQDVSLNVGAAVLAIFLTVFLIDAAIRRNERRERLRVQRVAFQRLRTPLVRHLQVLFGLYKAAVTVRPQKCASDVQGFFADDYFVQIAFLDFSKPAPVASLRALQWFDYLKTQFEDFRSALSRTVGKYALYLDVEAIELLEQMINSSFLSLVIQAPALRELDRKKGFKRSYNLLGGEGVSDLVREYVRWFAQLVEAYNKNVKPGEQLAVTSELWRNDISPQIGSARMSP